MSGWGLVSALIAAAGVAWWLPSDGLGRLRAGRDGGVLGRLRRRPGALESGRRTALLPTLPRRREVARAAALRRSAPAVCALLAVCLDAGAPPRFALREVAAVVGGPAGRELEAVVRRIDVGLDEAQAWLDLAQVPGYHAVGRDVARAIRSGLGLADLLRHHAAEAHRDLAGAALVRARSASVRGVIPLMVCFLPAFIALGVVPIFGSFTFHLPLP
ncbi:type II secretion system F family protein [Propioniciclava coleopterorum]|uniref:Type II secretion system F family protein n=1 Tax=Propioniciclava coleopterorum TaxID=2714937 RepID=A0A6G7Y4K1_9ACTN|nr:type II secretion system F family protein [Propioniciclava coleopterorum]QIK71814.1 type II secretion system F family protein [Propioniciclava coleopterorum]